MNFQSVIATLHQFWSDRGCLIVQPYDTEKGAGTKSPHTFLRAIGPEPWSVAYVEPCRRPSDGRYGENPNRGQHYYQYQVLINLLFQVKWHFSMCRFKFRYLIVMDHFFQTILVLIKLILMVVILFPINF